MTTAAQISGFIEAHASPPAGMLFYRDLESVRRDFNILGYVSVIESAWKEIGLDGVLCLDARPVLYLKKAERSFPERERIRLQRLFWNQGVANVLILADPDTVRLYSGLTRPQSESPDEAAAEKALVESVAYADYIQTIETFYHGLASGRYYEKNLSKFDPEQTVDAWLLDSLRALRNALIGGVNCLEIQAAHAFIGRVLFLCYLLDREIVPIGSTAAGRTPTMRLAQELESRSGESRIDYLYKLFYDLKVSFNGNMFDQDLDSERAWIQPAHIDKLLLFLGGHEVQSGQRSLGFWPFNFKLIPVETISAIYEDFLTTEDPETQRGRGAFYTPRFLAEMVVDMAVRDDPNILEESFLDPACGSGIFLVILFNRIANRWIFDQAGLDNYAGRSRALLKILEVQIRGVDIQETACRIACFSLYLAYLSFFDPPDIKKHVEKTGQPLPKLLDYGGLSPRPVADIPVILCADFLSEHTLSGRTFGCIIGNPPWKGRGRKQIAQKFLAKTPKLLNRGGTGCLLLPTKILQNATDAFQAEWLEHVSLNRVVQLADYRFLLFENAICPAFIAKFLNNAPDTGRHLIEFIAPKFNRDGLRKGVIAANPKDRAWIPLTDVLCAARSKMAPVVWKRRLWGTVRDQKFLDLLQSFPSLAEHVDILSELKGSKKRSKRWIAGQGIKPWPKKPVNSDRKPKPLEWPLDTKFLETRSWNSDLVLLPDDTISLSERLNRKQYRTDVLYSQPPADLFQKPMVLVSQGFTKVVFSDADVLFQDSIQSIAGPAEDASLLMFLAAFLGSNLARYYLFHTAANWGSERDKVHLKELLRVPFPLPGSEFISNDANEIVKTVSERMGRLRSELNRSYRNLRTEATRYSPFGGDDDYLKKRWKTARREQVQALQKELQPLVYRYFGLSDQEIALVEDTLQVFEPSSTPTTWKTSTSVTLDQLENTKVSPYATEGLGAYADTLTNTLNNWAETQGSQYRVFAEGGMDDHTGLAMVIISMAKHLQPFRTKRIDPHLFTKLHGLYNDSTLDRGAFIYHRDILLFHDNKIFILRPNLLLNWTRTAALNDSARIFGEIALAHEAS